MTATTKPPTPSQLEAWQRLCDSATPEPWHVDDGAVWGRSGSLVVCDFYDTPDDATFIATAREALPALIAEVERLRAEAAELRKWPRCKQCGGAVEDERRCYEFPQCYECLPPPQSLERITPPRSGE